MNKSRTDTSQPSLRLLSLGAGVQSTALLLMACEGRIPPFDHALFADTGWEPGAVYEQLARVTRFGDTAGIPVHRVSSGNIRHDALQTNTRFVTMPLHVRNPDGTKGMARRQCTAEYKIKPLKAAARRLLGFPHPTRVPRGVFAEQAIGISIDEVHRAKDADVRYLRNIFPLLELGMTRDDCVQYLTERGFGDTIKSACVGRPYSSNARLRWLRDHDPHAWHDLVAFDSAIRKGNPRATADGKPLRGSYFVHRSLTPLADVDLTARRHRHGAFIGDAPEPDTLVVPLRRSRYRARSRMNNPYYRDDTIELHLGDALHVMASLPVSSVDCVVTSPPHWGLRDYGTATWIGGNPECQHTLGTTPHQRRTTKKQASSRIHSTVNKRCRTCGAHAHDRQYGLEPTIDDYVDRLRQVSAEVRRVLTPRGTYWLNLRDGFSYHNSGTGSTRKMTNKEAPSVVRHKSLMGIPWRAALALQQDGWIIRNAMVWHKPNGIPDPASDRFSSRYEMVFLLVKQPDYYFDAARALEPLSQSRPEHRKNHRGGNKPHTVRSPWQPRGTGKNVGDVWSLSTRPLPDAHCAPFPIDLPQRCIAVGCPENGRVLDPFSGAGTTGLAARQLGRSFQGIDLRPDYHDIFIRRLLGELPSDAGEAA